MSPTGRVFGLSLAPASPLHSDVDLADDLALPDLVDDLALSDDEARPNAGMTTASLEVAFTWLSRLLVELQSELGPGIMGTSMLAMAQGVATQFSGIGAAEIAWHMIHNSLPRICGLFG